MEIAHVIPGDQILFELTRKKRLPQKGRLLEIVTPSPDRVEPRCLHARTCGGCSWQQMAYPAQLKEKEERVKRAFRRTPDPIIPSPVSFGYRNKMEFTFSENRGGQKYLGLMIAQAEPYVFNLTECHLTSPWFAAVLSSVRAWWETSPLKAYYPPADAGSLRYLTLREGVRTSQKMAILNVSGNPDYALTWAQLDGFVRAVQAHGEFSIFLRIHHTKKGTPTHFTEMHLAGPDHILEELRLDGQTLVFKISPSSFFQPNTLSAEILYNTAISMLPEARLVYDLYCGTGSLGMAASKRAKQVIGIELSPEAVLDAEENMRRNGIENMTFFEGDAGKVITRLVADPAFTRPDAVIVDPPRAGLDALALHHLKTLRPKAIVYVSCNPLTQAANVAELTQAGYQLQRIQPVDQFPHTYHIENICLLTCHH
ncbi:MAG: 23S rRNA (uracil(1939)-C(5))-methyltransferase RlmD [Verrucomicrobia bacterium]|nr:23S rRNA (uracil(1939)-C(5))-methyltransferase RlmD [Verrucomicrobiota bacterium]MDE3047933.1 23S rRNA (uracil(1939)-C(5))-methyltransferase RlmD [Verrucomicrobiota bacterium]